MSKDNKRKKSKHKQGTINGSKTGSTLTKKERQQAEYYSLLKILYCCICILIMVFVLNLIIRSNFTFNGVNYEEPKENEVVEVVSSSDDKTAERITLNLKGNLTMKLTVGQTYSEPGFEAISDLKGDISKYVEVSGKVDTSKAGTYRLTYTLYYRGISPKLTRLVKVSEKSSSSNSSQNNDNSTSKPTTTPSTTPSTDSKPNDSSGEVPSPSTKPSPSPKPNPVQGNITLSLNGSATVYIVEGDTYKDAGAVAKDHTGKNVSNQITMSGSVNTNKAGTYKITYSINNYNGQKLTVVRNVVVQNMKIALKLDNSNYTNKAVNIIVTANVDNFSYMVLPNGQKITSKTYEYRVEKNGIYEFLVYNTAGFSRKASMVVKNIDKEKPKGTCKVTHNSTGSIITITATDNVGIASYTYSGNTYNTNKITFNRHIQEGIQMNVGFYDKAGNFGNANCISPAVPK